MQIRYKKLFEDVEIGGVAHLGDAGLDLRSREDKILAPGERYCFKIGLAFEIPLGYVGLIWDRSGLSLKQGVKTLGGVVDASYRGEIGISLVNLSDKNVEIEKGERIAQILIQKVEEIELEETESLTETVRGEGGFGGTGRK